MAPPQNSYLYWQFYKLFKPEILNVKRSGKHIFARNLFINATLINIYYWGKSETWTLWSSHIGYKAKRKEMEILCLNLIMRNCLTCTLISRSAPIWQSSRLLPILHIWLYGSHTPQLVLFVLKDAEKLRYCHTVV